jgi:hypothetical protein
VVRTAPPLSVAPTATQRVASKHEIPARTVIVLGTGCPCQVTPPSVVASIAAVTPLPKPTTQQWVGVPQDTAVALLIWPGAGWPDATTGGGALGRRAPDAGTAPD